ncbi:MAG: hypothetical protein RQ833_01590 [Sphingomonadaceae bacterium]|nr:hypothetical protein [Sphingomonadaceae bacterium]
MILSTALASAVVPHQSRAQFVASGSATGATVSGGTITVQNSNATINWTPLDSNSGASPINFLPATSTVTYTGVNGLGNYTVINRVLPLGGATGRAIAFNGQVTSRVLNAAGAPVTGGTLVFYTPGGIVVSNGASFTIGSLVLTTADPAVLGADSYRLNSTAGSQNGVTIQSGATINALNPNSYVALVAPRVTQGGRVNVNGAAAYVAAEGVDITFQPNALYNVTIRAGSDAGSNPQTFSHTGVTQLGLASGVVQQQRVLMAAVAKNDAITMLVGGDVRYANASGASLSGDSVILTAGRPQGQATGPTGPSVTLASGALGTTVSATSQSTLTLQANRIDPSVFGEATGSAQLLTTAQPNQTLRYGGDVTLYGAEKLLVSDLPGATQTTLAIAGNLILNAPPKAVETGTISLGNGAELTAQNIYLDVSAFGSGPNIDAVGGVAAVRVTGTDSVISTAGSLAVRANATGAVNGGGGQGGTASITVDGGTIQAGSGIAVAATATGYSNTVPVVGGSATIQAINAGAISVAGGTITVAASATADGSGPPQPSGLDNRGGSATISATTAGSISAGGIAVDATFQGQGSQGRSGRGGAATLTASDLGSAIAARTPVGIIVDASAYGGGAGVTAPSGGSAQGGNAILSALDGALVTSRAGTGTAIRVSANGVGALSSDGGNGGNGIGGLARVRVDSQVDTGSAIDATDSYVAVSASGTGGRAASGGLGGPGGAGSGGTAQIQIGTLSSLTAGGIGVAAAGFGGNGGSSRLISAGGAGGAGTGNRAEITLAQSGQLVITGRAFITVDASGRGGDGGDGLAGTLGDGPGTGGSGGVGTGGVAQLTLTDTASIIADAASGNDVSFGISAGAQGGRGGAGTSTISSPGAGGAGGQAQAGSALLSADIGSSIQQGSNGFSFAIAADSTSGSGGGDAQPGNGSGVQGGTGGAAGPGSASVSLSGDAGLTIAGLGLSSSATGGGGGDGTGSQPAGLGGAATAGNASLTLAGTSLLDALTVSVAVTGSGGAGGAAANGTITQPGTGGAGGGGTGGTVQVRQDAGTTIQLRGVAFAEGRIPEFFVNASGSGGDGGAGGSPSRGSGGDAGAGGAGQGGSITLSLAGSYSPATTQASVGQSLRADGSGGDGGIGGTLPFAQGTTDRGGNGGLGGAGSGGSVQITLGSSFTSPSAAPRISVSTTGGGGAGGNGGSPVDPTDPGFVAGVNAGDNYDFGKGGRAGDITGGSVVLSTGGPLTLGSLNLGATVAPGQAGVGYVSRTASGVPVLQTVFGCCATQSFGRGVTLDLTGTLTADSTVLRSFGPAALSSTTTGAFAGTDGLTITATGQTDILVPVNLQAGLSISATGPDAPNYIPAQTGDINLAASTTASNAFLLTFDGSINLSAPMNARIGGISLQSAAIAITGSGAATATQGNIDIGPLRNAVFGGAGGSGSPYELTQSGFNRLKARAINVQNLNTISFTVRDLTIQGTGFGPTAGNIVSTGQANAPAIAFSTPGDLRVEGRVRVANAGRNDLISFISGGRLQLVLPSGSVSVFDSSGQVTGRAFLYASQQIVAATDGQLASLLATQTPAARNAILAQATGTGTPYLAADRVSLRAGQAYWGADTGDGTTRAGIFVGPGNPNSSAGLDIRQGVIAPMNIAAVNGLDPDQQFSQYAIQTGPAEIFGYGRSTLLTNNDFLSGPNPGISFIQSEVTPQSTFNNCNLQTGCQSQPPVTPAFQGSFSIASGSVAIDRSVNNLDTITVQAAGTHVINWTPFDSGGGAPINFLPFGSTGAFVGAGGVAGFTVINRVLPLSATTPIALNGTITSTINGQPGGNVFFYAPGGIIIGATAAVNVGGLVLTSGDPVFQSANSWRFDSQQSGALVQVQAGAQITAQQSVQLVAPIVQQAGSVKVGGSAIYVAAQQTDVTLDDAAGRVNVGLGGSLALAPNTIAISHTGSTDTLSGFGAQAVFVAAPSNGTIQLQLGGTLGNFVQGVSGAGVGFSSGDTTISFRPGANFTGATLGDTTVSFSQTLAPLQLTSGNTRFTPATGGSVFGGRVAASGSDSLRIDTRSADRLIFQNGLTVASGSSIATGKPTLISGDGRLNVSGPLTVFASGPLTISAPVVADTISAFTQQTTIGAQVTARSASFQATGPSGSISVATAPDAATNLTLTADQGISSNIPLTLASLGASAGTQIQFDALTVTNGISLRAPRISLFGSGVSAASFSASGDGTGQFNFGRISVADSFSVSGTTQLFLRAPLSARVITVSSPTAAMQLDVSSPQPASGDFRFADVQSLEQAANIRGGANTIIGNLRSDAGASVNTGGALTIASINSGSSAVSLTSGGPTEVTGAIRAGDLTVTAGPIGNPSLSTVNLDGALTITNLNVSASGALSVAQNLTLPGFVSVNAASASFQSVQAQGDVTAITNANAGALSFNGALSGANLFLRGLTIDVSGATSATGYVDASSNNRTSFAGLTAADAVTLNATLGRVSTTGTTQGTRIGVTGGSAVLGAMIATDSAGPGINVTTTNGLVTLNGAINAPSLSVSANGPGSDITINGALTVSGNARFVSVNGSGQTDANGSITANVDLAAGGLIFGVYSTGGSNGDIRLRAAHGTNGINMQAQGAITFSGAVTGGGIFAENGGSQTFQAGIDVGPGGVSLFGGTSASTLTITGTTRTGRIAVGRGGSIVTGDIVGAGLTNEILLGVAADAPGSVTTGALNGGRVDLNARGAGNAVTTGPVTVTGDANFGSDGAIQLGNVSAGTALNVTRGTTLSAGTLGASNGAITVSGGVTTQAISFTSGGSITAGGAIQGTTVSTGTGGFSASNAGAPAATGTIAYSSIASSGPVQLTAAGQLTAPSISASALAISSTGALTLPTLTIGGAITISGGQSGVTLGRAGQTLTVGALSVTGAAGPIQLLGGVSTTGAPSLPSAVTLATSAGGVRIGGATSTGALTLTSSGSSPVTLGALTVTGATAIDSGTGLIGTGAIDTGVLGISRSGGLNAPSVLARTGRADVTATGPIAIAGNYQGVGGTLAATGATGSITIGGSATTAAALTLNADQSISVGAVSTGSSSLDATAGGTASFASLSGGALTVQSGGLLSVSGPVNASVSATLGSTGAGMTLGNGLAVALTGAARLLAAGPIDIAGTTSAGALILTTTGANGTARLRGPVQLGSVTGLPGDFSASTSGLLTLDSTLTANSLSGPGGFAKTGGASFGGQVTLANGLALQSAGAVNFNGRLQVNAGGLSVTTSAGAISFAQPVGVTGAVSLNSASGLTIGGGLSVIPGNGVTLSAAGPIDVTGQLIADSIGITTTAASGTVQLRGGATTVGALMIDASGDVAAGGTLTAQTTTITGAGAGTFAALNPQGPLSIRTAGSLQVSGSLGFLTGGRFAVSLRSTGAGITLLSNLFASDAVLGAAGPISVAGQVQAATLALTATGANGSAQFNGPVTLGGALTANLSAALGFGQGLTAASVGGPQSGPAQALSATFSGPVSVTSALALSTTGGSISFGSTLAAGSLALAAAGGTSGIGFTGPATIGGAAGLSAPGAVNASALFQAAALSVSAGSASFAGISAPTGLVSLTTGMQAQITGPLAAQSLTITTTANGAPITLTQPASVGGTLTLNAAGQLTTGDLSGGTLTLKAGTSAGLGALTSTGGATVNAAGAIAAGAIDTVSGLQLVSTGAGVTAGTVRVRQGDVTLSAAGPIATGNLQAAGLSVTATGANGTAAFSDIVSLTNALTLATSGATAIGSSLSAASIGGPNAGPALVAGFSVAGPTDLGGAAAIQSTGAIDFGGPLSAGSLSLVTTNGALVRLNGAATLGGAANVNAAGDLAVNQPLAAGSILFVSGGAGSFGNSALGTSAALTATGPLSVQTAGALTIEGAAIGSQLSLTGTSVTAPSLRATSASGAGAAVVATNGQATIGDAAAPSLSVAARGANGTARVTGALRVPGAVSMDADGTVVFVADQSLDGPVSLTSRSTGGPSSPSIQAQALRAGGGLTVRSAGYVQSGGLSGGAIDAQATGYAITGGVNAGTSNVVLAATGTATPTTITGPVTAGRFALAALGSPVTVGNVTTTGGQGVADEIVISSLPGSISAGTLTGGRVSLAASSIVTAAISAGAGGLQADATSGGASGLLRVGAINSGGAVTLTTASNTVTPPTLQTGAISAPSLTITGGAAETIAQLNVPGPVSLTGAPSVTLGQAGQTLTVGSLSATNITGPITLLGNLSASGDVTLATLGSAGISTGAIGGGNLALTSAGLISTGDLFGSSLNASVGSNASLGALGITNGAVVNAVGQLTLGQVTAGSLRASGSQLRIAGGQITGNAALTATGLVTVGGSLAARSTAVTGGDFQLGATARLGGTGTSTITLRSTNSNGTAAGGAPATGVFSVDQGEFSRMVAQTITLNAPGDLSVGALSLRGALSADPNLTASTLELTSQGNLRVTDAVAITQAAPGDIIRLSAGRNLQVVTPTGSVSITAPDGSLTGTAQLYAGTSSNRVLGQVLVGSDQLGTDLARLATASADARRARIAMNDGPVNTAGYVQAGAIELLSTGQIYVQNSGTLTGPFAGLTTGAGGLSVGVRPLGSTVPVEVIGFGRSVVNGVTTSGFEFARTVQYFPAALSDPSFINNCNLLAPTCGGAFQGSPQVARGSADFQRSPTLDIVTLNTSVPTVLNWTPYDSTGTGPVDFLPAGNIGRFLGAPGLTGFTVINRVLPSDPTRAIALNGTIQSQLQTTQGATSTGGTVVFYAPGGVIIGTTAQVSVGSLLLTSADVSTNDGRTFSLAAQAGSQSLVQIQSGAQVSALNEGSFVALFGPRVAQAGAIEVAGTAAFVSAEAGTLTFNPDATYAVNITRGAVTPSNFSQLLQPDGSLSFFYSVDLGGSITGSGASAGSGRSLVAVVAPSSGSAASRLNAAISFGAPQTGARASEILLASGASATGISGSANVPSTSAALGSVAFRGGSYGPNVRAVASGIVDVLAGGPNASGETASALRFDGSVAAGGGAGVYLDASGQTLQIAGDLTVAAPAGAKLVRSNFEADAENGGTLSIGGTVSVASAAVPGSTGVIAGGRAAMIATGGSRISVGGNLSLSSDGAGGGLQAPGQPAQPGGGGFSVVNAVAGGQFAVGGDVTLSARGAGVDPTAPGVIRGGISGVIVDGSGSGFSARSATLISTASASAGQTAGGGQTNVRASNGGILAIAGALNLDATAQGATGSAAPGGVINLNSDGSGFIVGGALTGQGGSLAGTRTGTVAANSIALTLDQGASEAAALTAMNGITLTAGAPVTLAALNAGGAANVSTTGALTVGSLTADSLALAAARAAGALTLNGPVQVANAATLSAGSNLIASGAVTAGSLNVTAGNAATFNAPITVKGVLGLNVGGAASFAQALNAGSIGALSLAAQVGSASFGGRVQVGGGVNLTANAGALSFASRLDTGALTLASAGLGAGLSFAQAVAATGPVALTAAGPVAFSGGLTAPSVSVNTTGAGGTVAFGPGATITNALAVTASADVGSKGALSAGSLALTTPGNASFAALTLGAPSTLSVGQQLALAGTLRGGDVTAAVGTARFADVVSTGAFGVSGGSTTFGGLLQAASLNLNVAAVQFGGAVTIGGGAGITSGGGVSAINPFSADTLTLTTPGAIQFASLSSSGATLNSGTSVTITGAARVTNLLSATAAGPISFGGTVDAGSLSATATGASGSVGFAGPVTLQGAAQLSAAQGLTAGALTAGQLGVNAGSASFTGVVSVSGDAALAALGPIVIGNQFSSGSLAVLTTGTNGQVTLGGPVTVSGGAAIDARGLVRINSRFSAATISVDSADIAIGATASIGGANTSRATFLTSAAKASAMTVGGAAGAQGYQIDADELTRIRAGTIVLDPVQSPAGGGQGGSADLSGPVTVTANPRGAPVDITVDSFTIQGSAAQNPNLNPGSAPTLVITTGSNIRVIGQAAIANAGGADSLAMIAGGELRFLLGSYSSTSTTTAAGGATTQSPTRAAGASVTRPGGALAGQIYLLGTRVLAGYTETLAAIDRGESGASLRRALATNYGTIRPEGFLQADRIELRPATAALFQNVGGQGVYAGLSVGAGGLGIRQGALAATSTADYGSIASVEQALRQTGEANVIAFGRQSAASGVVINGDFVPPVRRVAAQVTETSEINGCNLRGGACLSPIGDGDPISVAQMVSEMVIRPATDSVEAEERKKKTKSDPTPADHSVRHDGDQTPPLIVPPLRTDLVDPSVIRITGAVAEPAGGAGNDAIWAPSPAGNFTDAGDGSSESNRPTGGAGSVLGAIGSERNAGAPTVDAGTLSGSEAGAGGSSSSNRNNAGSVSGSIGSERNAGTGTVNPGTMSGGETQSSGSAKPNGGGTGSTGSIGSERNAGTGTVNPGTMSGGETQSSGSTKPNGGGTGSTGSIGSERNSGNAPASQGTMSGGENQNAGGTRPNGGTGGSPESVGSERGGSDTPQPQTGSPKP